MKKKPVHYLTAHPNKFVCGLDRRGIENPEYIIIARYVTCGNCKRTRVWLSRTRNDPRIA